MSFLARIHPFPSEIPHSCAYELFPSSSAAAPRNAVIFVGGIGDGPQTVPFIRSVAQAIQEDSELSFSVFETRMRSSLTNFGRCSLKSDVEDVAALVKYLRSLGRERIVLMGHSTGSQDCTAYAKDGAEAVDGYILQAPVSDREAVVPAFASQEKVDTALRVSQDMIRNGHSEGLVPAESSIQGVWDVPMTAYRLNSFLAPGGDDDFFSTDLTEDQCTTVWSRFTKPLLIVPSADDEYYNKKFPYDELVEKWKSYCRPGVASNRSGPVSGANHTVDKAEGRANLAQKVVGFLKDL